MNKISLLDCTLRDGGYLNEFNFGKSTIKSVIKKISEASIDIVEIGFLRSKENNPDKTLFGNIESIKNLIEKKHPSTMYIAMLRYGDITAEEISPFDGKSIDGIRISFHKDEISQSLILAKKLMDMGYKIFLQVIGTTVYSDAELLNLIEQVNLLRPFAFYIVDTLGMMYPEDVLRFFYLIDHNLNDDIALGFHSHNNLQMSLSNAQTLIQANHSREIIIDASILGMGRGAGNLNMELMTRFMNRNYNTNYDEIKILEIMDKYISPLKGKYQWGYDVAYYLAAINGCHPNYAKFLRNKKMLSAQDMSDIFQELDSSRRHLFNKSYIEQIYNATTQNLAERIPPLDIGGGRKSFSFG